MLQLYLTVRQNSHFWISTYKIADRIHFVAAKYAQRQTEFARTQQISKNKALFLLNWKNFLIHVNTSNKYTSLQRNGKLDVIHTKMV